MMTPIHTNLSSGRWHTFSLAMQMGNIGSEVNRLLLRLQHDQTHSIDSVRRVLELIDLSISDPRFLNRSGEFLRLREVIADFIQDKRQYAVSAESLKKYFEPFMIRAAALPRG